MSQRPPSAGSGDVGGVFLEQWTDSELHVPSALVLQLSGGACGADDGADGESAPLSDALQALVVHAMKRQAPLRLLQHLVLPLMAPGGKVLGALLCESPDASCHVRNSTSLQHAASAIAGVRPTTEDGSLCSYVCSGLMDPPKGLLLVRVRVRYGMRSLLRFRQGCCPCVCLVRTVRSDAWRLVGD